MPKITLTHDEPYSGRDPGNGCRLDMKPGDVADVSEEKLEQLLADFPDRFKKGGTRRKPAAKTEPDPPAETYADLEGDELRTAAALRDIAFDDDADDDAVRAALVAADQAEAAAD